MQSTALRAGRSEDNGGGTYQLENCHLHHTLVEVRWLVLDHLHSHNVMSFHVLTFHHLAECALAKDVENQVSCQIIRKEVT